MARRAVLTLLGLLLAAPCAAEPPAGPNGLKGRASPSPGTVRVSPDGRFTWVEGEGMVSVARKPGKKPKRIRLPAGPKKGWSRRLLFPRHGPFFCVLDEERTEVGLHLKVARGARAAKAVVVQSVLSLLNKDGHVLWKKRMRDEHLVGRDNGGGLSIANDGTLGILLQDADPYTKARPVLLVIDRRGYTRLRLDYLDWKHIDEFLLSDNGRYLALKGYGKLEDMETWSKAVGFYRLGTKTRWTRAVPDASDERNLESVDPGGRVCCVRVGPAVLAFSRDGDPENVGTEKRRRFNKP